MLRIQKLVKLRVNFLSDGALLVSVTLGKLKGSSYRFFIIRGRAVSMRGGFVDIISKRVLLRKFFSIARLLERCDKNGLVS